MNTPYLFIYLFITTLFSLNNWQSN